jgi:hypothetical protein
MLAKSDLSMFVLARIDKKTKYPLEAIDFGTYGVGYTGTRWQLLKASSLSLYLPELPPADSSLRDPIKIAGRNPLKVTLFGLLITEATEFEVRKKLNPCGACTISLTTMHILNLRHVIVHLSQEVLKWGKTVVPMRQRRHVYVHTSSRGNVVKTLWNCSGGVLWETVQDAVLLFFGQSLKLFSLVDRNYDRMHPVHKLAVTNMPVMYPASQGCQSVHDGISSSGGSLVSFVVALAVDFVGFTVPYVLVGGMPFDLSDADGRRASGKYSLPELLPKIPVRLHTPWSFARVAACVCWDAVVCIPFDSRVDKVRGFANNCEAIGANVKYHIP